MRQLEVKRNERASIAAKLANPSDTDAPEDSSCCIQIRAPVTGRVLKLIQKSENVVLPGAPLIEIGNPRDLEVVADLLSTDAGRRYEVHKLILWRSSRYKDAATIDSLASSR